MAYFADFEINIVSALSDQLVTAFKDLERGALSEERISAMPSGQGVYQLFHEGALVYVGKADSLPRRLNEHFRKISGRHNIDGGKMSFKALFVHPNWTALAPEDALIKYYRNSGAGECAWNGNGFGPHDPGRERETTNKPVEGFDAQYPIRDNWPCEWITVGTYDGRDLLRSFKAGLPYLLRYQTTGSLAKGHPDYNGKQIDVSRTGMAARELLKTIVEQLPGWQATIFPSHMILYKEQRSYTHGEVL